MLCFSCGFEAVVPGETSHVPVCGFGGLWLWSALPGTHLGFLQPYQGFTQSSHGMLHIEVCLK